MAKFTVTVNVIYRKEMTVYANDEDEAQEKAANIAREWNNVFDAEAVEVERE